MDLPPHQQIFDLSASKLIALLTKIIPDYFNKIENGISLQYTKQDLQEYKNLIEEELDERQTTYDWIENQITSGQLNHNANASSNGNSNETINSNIHPKLNSIKRKRNHADFSKSYTKQIIQKQEGTQTQEKIQPHESTQLQDKIQMQSKLQGPFSNLKDESNTFDPIAFPVSNKHILESSLVNKSNLNISMSNRDEDTIPEMFNERHEILEEYCIQSNILPSSEAVLQYNQQSRITNTDVSTPSRGKYHEQQISSFQSPGNFEKVEHFLKKNVRPGKRGGHSFSDGNSLISKRLSMNSNSSPTNYGKNEKKFKYQVHKDIYKNPVDNLPKSKITDELNRTVQPKVNSKVVKVSHVTKTSTNSGFLIVNPNRQRRDLLFKKLKKMEEARKAASRPKKLTRSSNQKSNTLPNNDISKRKKHLGKMISMGENFTQSKKQETDQFIEKESIYSSQPDINEKDESKTSSYEARMTNIQQKTASNLQLLPSCNVDTDAIDNKSSTSEPILRTNFDDIPTRNKYHHSEGDTSQIGNYSFEESTIDDGRNIIYNQKYSNCSDMNIENILHCDSTSFPKIQNSTTEEKEDKMEPTSNKDISQTTFQLGQCNTNKLEKDENSLALQSQVHNFETIPEDINVKVENLSHRKQISSSSKNINPGTSKKSVKRKLTIVATQAKSETKANTFISLSDEQPTLDVKNDTSMLSNELSDNATEVEPDRIPKHSAVNPSLKSKEINEIEKIDLMIDTTPHIEEGVSEQDFDTQDDDDINSVQSITLSDLSTTNSKDEDQEMVQTISTIEKIIDGNKSKGTKALDQESQATISGIEKQYLNVSQKKSTNIISDGSSNQKQGHQMNKALKISNKLNLPNSECNSKSKTNITDEHISRSKILSIYERRCQKNEIIQAKHRLIFRLLSENNFYQNEEIDETIFNDTYTASIRRQIENLDPILLLNYLNTLEDFGFKIANELFSTRCKFWKKIIPEKVNYSQFYRSFYDIFTVTTRVDLVQDVSNAFIQKKGHRQLVLSDSNYSSLLKSVLVELEDWFKYTKNSTNNNHYILIEKDKAEVHEIVSNATLSSENSNWEMNASTNSMWNVYWSWSKPQVDRRKLLVWQKINHFSHAKHLTNKDFLKRSIDRYTRVPGRRSEEFSIMPPTFSLPQEYIKLVEAYSENEGRPWIVKPIGQSRGRGIRIVTDVSRVDHNEHVVVQRYIENPLLLDGFKFDLRLYVLCTRFQPLEAYIYTDGFARFSSERFSLDQHSLKNMMIHLTNTSIQQKAMKGTQKILISELIGRLTEKGYDWNLIWNRIVQLIIKSLICVEDIISEPKNPTEGAGFDVNSFEVFGYDVLINNHLDCWLLEVNASPSMEKHGSIDYLKDEMIRDTLLVLEPMYFDRFVLKSVIERRLSKKGKRAYYRSTVDTQSELNDDLKAILHGKIPRVYGQAPSRLHETKYQMIAPSSMYEKYRKIAGTTKK